jgi:flagellar hook assembly protein FlgD
VSNDPWNDTLTIYTQGTGKQVTGIAENATLPTTYGISPNYPNPFNPTTTIKYQLPHQSDIRLTIYNVLGQKVRTLLNEKMEAGYYSVDWDGRNDLGVQVGSGIYIYRFSADSYHRVQKMILMK